MMARARRVSVLIVDDEPLIRRFIAMSLQKGPYEVLQAEDAHQAIALMNQEEHVVDVAVVDLVLPGMDGERLVERLRMNNPGLPVIFVSGQTFVLGHTFQEPYSERTWFLQKPFTPSDLLATVAQAAEVGGLPTSLCMGF